MHQRGKMRTEAIRNDRARFIEVYLLLFTEV